MQGRQIIAEILRGRGIGWTEFVKMLGTNDSIQNVRQRILRPGEENPKDLTVDLLVKYSKALGYEVVVRKRGKKVKEGEYIIGGEEE